VLAVIDESGRRGVTAGTAQPRVVRKRPREQRLTALLGGARRPQMARRIEARIGQEVDVLDIHHQRIEQLRGWRRSCELVDDRVGNEVAQRRHAPVMTVRSQIACAAQARDRHGIQHAIVGPAIEHGARGIECSRNGSTGRE